MSETASYYSENASQLVKQYDSLEFENVHRSWKWCWPTRKARVLDVGAGSGRDVRWFFERGCFVVAVEPVSELLQLGSSNSYSRIQWVDDSLPGLDKTKKLCYQYDLILLSAVWMHLDFTERREAIVVLSELLSENGKLVITLRHGQFSDSRNTYSLSVEQLDQLSETADLRICNVAEDVDLLDRSDVYWQTVVLERKNMNKGKEE